MLISIAQAAPFLVNESTVLVMWHWLKKDIFLKGNMNRDIYFVMLFKTYQKYQTICSRRHGKHSIVKLTHCGPRRSGSSLMYMSMACCMFVADSSPKCALWDVGMVHCGICGIGLLLIYHHGERHDIIPQNSDVFIQEYTPWSNRHHGHHN